MFGSWRGKGRTPIGIDFGTRGVRAVQLARNGDRWRVAAAGAVALPSENPGNPDEHLKAQAKALCELLESGSFRGNRVVTALPSAMVQYKNLRLPPMPPGELRTAVEWEAADRLKLGQSHQIQFFDAGEVRQGEELRQEIILLATPAAMVETHVKLLTECGLEPQAIDVDAGALARCSRGCSDRDDLRAKLVLDLGVNGSNVLICQQARVMFIKRIEIGGRHIEEAVAKQFSMTPAEAAQILLERACGTTESGSTLVNQHRRDANSQAINDAIRPILTELSREVALCLRYQGVTFRGQRADTALLTGGGAGDPLLPEVLAQETGVTVAPLDTNSRFDWTGIDETTVALASKHAWAVAIGLALRSTESALSKEAA